jgi:competence ComEA-like helix-hairpin-helix protein
VRWWLLDPGDAPGGVTILGAEEGALAAQRDSAKRVAEPLAPGELVDLNLAPAREIDRLPGVGPSLAVRIVEYRTQYGPFGSLQGLDSVPGMGAATLGRIASQVRFSGVSGLAGSSGGRSPPTPSSEVRAAVSKVLLNFASANDLAGLPGIGPERARAIVAYREAHGSFASIDDLEKVPGIGPATVAKLRPSLDVR